MIDDVQRVIAASCCSRLRPFCRSRRSGCESGERVMEFFLGAFTAEWEQRQAALLHDLSLGRRTLPDEDEQRRRGGAAATAGSSRDAKPAAFGCGRAGMASGDRSRSIVRRPADARTLCRPCLGSQPAVVKMASFGGGSRLGAMINYVSRNGDVVVENERGDQLRGRDQLSAVGGEWDHLMKNRAESRDIGLFKISVAEGGRDGDETSLTGRGQIVRQGLGDRAFVFAVTVRPDGSGFDIDGIDGASKLRGERLTADDKATAIVQRRLDAERSGGAAQASGSPAMVMELITAPVACVRWWQRIRARCQRRAGARDRRRASRRATLFNSNGADQLHSRKPRDVMHLILSARAGTDAAAFQDAARDFLGTQFAGHRYVFSLHDAASDPKTEETGGKRPHVHVHAIIAMRSDAGDRIETTIPAFRQWRLTMAEKARAHGINMEMTDRRDRASPPAYSRNQVRPVNTIGRTQHEGTSAAAQRRYDAKRDGCGPAFRARRAARPMCRRPRRVA